jgi:ubiquinone/menaquinone biosynthesis C-methylase UbiE
MASMSPEDYDAWYRSPRGKWTGETEYRLLTKLLRPMPGESLLDIGCGTGYFTRRFAESGLAVTGVDPSPAMLGFAGKHAVAGERFVFGDARALPFPDRSFDLVISVTALCFIPEQVRALSEMLRVTRRRFAIGLLNRNSLLFLEKGRDGGSGGYRGAHWHTMREVKSLFSNLPVQDLTLRTAILIPGGGRLSVVGERLAGEYLSWGAFIVAAGGRMA